MQASASSPSDPALTEAARQAKQAFEKFRPTIFESKMRHGVTRRVIPVEEWVRVTDNVGHQPCLVF